MILDCLKHEAAVAFFVLVGREQRTTEEFANQIVVGTLLPGR